MLPVFPTLQSQIACRPVRTATRAWRLLPWALLPAAAAIIAHGAMATLKQVTGVHCPWDLVRYGGSALPGDAGGACFPAGHAAGGYAWVALAFVPATRAGRRAGLGVGLAAGLVFGIDQQLRGAHFLSHDLWSAALCWTVALIVAGLWPTPAEAAA